MDTAMLTPAGKLYRSGTPVAFAAVPKGAQFECNGNVWLKKSTRTAVLVWPAGPERAFYFAQSEVVRAERAA